MRQVDGTDALERVRLLRRSATEAEKLLWSRLRGRRLEGHKFYRQVWIGPFIVDFLRREAKLVVEVDGAQHGEHANYDARRSLQLARQNFHVIRFWNNEVTGNTTAVLTAIRTALLARVPSPSQASPGPLPLPSWERVS